MNALLRLRVKTRHSAGKILAMAFWNYKGVLLIEFPNDRRSVNAAYLSTK